VRQQLDLHVPGPLEVALAEDAVVAEGRLRLPTGGLERVVELTRRAHHAHPAAAASRRRLDHERKAELLRLPFRDDRHSGLPGDLLRGELVAAGAESLGGRADENEPGGLDGLRELRALREESVAGMDRVGAGRLRRSDVLLRVEVRGDLDDLVGRAYVER